MKGACWPRRQLGMFVCMGYEWGQCWEVVRRNRVLMVFGSFAVSPALMGICTPLRGKYSLECDLSFWHLWVVCMQLFGHLVNSTEL